MDRTVHQPTLMNALILKVEVPILPPPPQPSLFVRIKSKVGPNQCAYAQRQPRLPSFDTASSHNLSQESDSGPGQRQYDPFILQHVEDVVPDLPAHPLARPQPTPSPDQ